MQKEILLELGLLSLRELACKQKGINMLRK